MKKELLDKLSPLERLEYKIDCLFIDTDYLNIFMLIIIATTVGISILMTSGKNDSAYFIAILGGICAFLVWSIGFVSEQILIFRLEKEFTKKAIKNMEVKNEKEY